MNNKETKVVLIVVGVVLLVCCALASMFAVVTMFAASPSKAFEEARNVQRTADVNSLTNALTQYTVTPGNSIDDFDIPSCPRTAAIGTSSRAVDLSALVPNYLATIPLDPVVGSSSGTGYEICLEDISFVISAPHAEKGQEISSSNQYLN